MLAGFFSWMSSALACQPPGRAVPNALRNSGTPASSSAASSLRGGAPASGYRMHYRRLPQVLGDTSHDSGRPVQAQSLILFDACSA